jgi:uncharacterized integral membrane protein
VDEDRRDDDRGKGKSRTGALVGVVLVVVALGAFVLQNTNEVSIDWLVFDADMPLWLLLVIAGALGALLANLGGWLLRRRRN